MTRFIPGRVYEVGVSFGSYLLAEGAAEPVPDSPTQSFSRDRADDESGTPASRRK